jgi:hypothetical protein
MHFIASDDFLYDTVDVAIWSTVEQGLAITAGGLATLQPLFKLIGYKLGLKSHLSLPGRPGTSDNNIQMDSGGIAVKRSFTHTSETFAATQKKQYDHMALKLQPGVGVYEATACYHTSQEVLTRPSMVSDGKASKDLERGVVESNGGELPAGYTRYTIRRPPESFRL